MSTVRAAHEAAARDLGEKAVNQRVCRVLWDKIVPGILDRFDCPSMLRLTGPRMSGEQLRTVRAVEVLERIPYGFQIGNGFFLFVAVVLTAGMQTWYAGGQPESLLAPRMPLILRWLLIGVLSIVFIYLCLWPHLR
jgi:hypothetical protein